MPDNEKPLISSETDQLPTVVAVTPHIFISHDSRDAELAEAFSKLLKSVSAGMIKTFRSSDKKGTEGIDFGEEWYKRLMMQLQSTTDVVCLFTERSLDRPSILFEAGVAKGKLSTPVIGVALGVPLSSVSAGPFYQFMNMDDSEGDLEKLVNQLARRVPSLELDNDVVKSQVVAFKETEAKLLKKLASGSLQAPRKDDVEENAITKLAEEMKSLPSRVAERLSETVEPFRRRRSRKFHPMMIRELMHLTGESDDPVSVLMLAGLVRDDFPWLYELTAEVYRIIRDGDFENIESEIRRVQRIWEFTLRGPFAEDLAMGSKDVYFALEELPRMLERSLLRAQKERIRVRGSAVKVLKRSPAGRRAAQKNSE